MEMFLSSFGMVRVNISDGIMMLYFVDSRYITSLRNVRIIIKEYINSFSEHTIKKVGKIERDESIFFATIH